MKKRLTQAMVQWRRAVRDEGHSDRGDVPGWVLITLMTAGIVAVLWAVAEPTFAGLFDDAIDSVTGG